MKKFVLINSPLFWERTNEEEEYLSPLGLGYIATYLKKVGLEVLLSPYIPTLYSFYYLFQI